MTPEIALAAGFSVIPVGLNKKPLIPTWKPFQERLATREEFVAWKRMSPPAWAIITGELSKLVILDFDGERGNETLRKLRILPYVRTGSGGHHVYFLHPGWHV